MKPTALDNVISLQAPAIVSVPEHAFNESALWLCLNRQTMRSHIIHGPLAKILMEYPADYTLTFLRHEQRHA